MRRRQFGFGMLETLISMLLVGIILGIVARGYQALNRLSLASYQTSQQMEYSSFLQRLNYEVVGALSLEAQPSLVTFKRIDPTLNASYESPLNSRLPWPLPTTGIPSTPVDLLAPTYQESIAYKFNPSANEIVRSTALESFAVVSNIGKFTPQLDSNKNILTVELRPKEMTASSFIKIFLPVVKP